jgi:hypothetical protein
VLIVRMSSAMIAIDVVLVLGAVIAEVRHRRRPARV